jgi:GTPase SAR1 family protein
MFRQQTVLLEFVPAVRQIVARYPSWQTHPADWLESAESQASRFVVPVPLVGAFSAGKSTLINAVIGNPLLSTNIDPETAVPAEIWHSPIENLTGCLPGGQRVAMSRDAVRTNQVQALQGGGWIEAALPIPLMQNMPHLKLVDMPGWDSGIQAHSTAIDGYAARSLAYGVAVSADEGNLRESIRCALRELAVRDMPIFVVITKADKKLPEEVEAIKAQVAHEVEKTIGKPPFLVCQASARKKDLAGFIAALDDIECRAETLFSTHAAQPFAQQLTSLSRHLDTLLNSDDLDTEKIAAQCAQLETDMQAFAGHLQTETAQLDARVQPVMGRIQQHMENRLLAQLDSLTSSALSGGDLSGPIGTTLRLAVEEGMRDEFNPEVEHYLGRVAEGLPATFKPTASGPLNLGGLGSIGSAKEADSSIWQLPSVLAPAMLFLTKLHPAVAVIATVGTLLFGLFKNKATQQDEENRRREAALNQIRQDVIPTAVSQACAALLPVLRDNVALAKQKIAHSVQVQQSAHEAALAELKNRLAQGRVAFTQACEQYQTDRDTLQAIVRKLS